MSNQHGSPSLQGLPERMVNLEEAAFLQFANYFGPRLLSLFLRSNLSQTDAEDLAASCVTDIALKVPRFRSSVESNFAGWVFTLARHALSDWFRTQPATRPLIEEIPVEEKGFSAILDLGVTPNAIVDCVQRALGELSDLDRAVVELRDLGAEHTYAEIAGMLDISVQLARVRHFRALKKLEIILQQDAQFTELLCTRR